VQLLSTHTYDLLFLVQLCLDALQVLNSLKKLCNFLLFLLNLFCSLINEILLFALLRFNVIKLLHLTTHVVFVHLHVIDLDSFNRYVVCLYCL